MLRAACWSLSEPASSLANAPTRTCSFAGDALGVLVISTVLFAGLARATILLARSAGVLSAFRLATTFVATIGVRARAAAAVRSWT